MPQPPKTLNQFADLVQVIADLRGPEGCPWDKEQNHRSLTPYAIEEVHEMVEAIETQDDSHIREELGDVLFQVVLHSQIAKERGAFEINDVIENITSKIVRRHPHVFSDVVVRNTDDVIKNWDEIKKAEKTTKLKSTKVIDVPPSMAALQRAHKIGEKTKKLDFDWSDALEVINQLKFEIVELEQAITSRNVDHIRHEIGDVLFSAAQVSRHLGVEPESSLRETNNRFLTRFEKMVEIVGGVDEFVRITKEEKEMLWSQAKRLEKT
jgi:tetrapyrrole methylase family protein/MazG family protein